MSSLKVAFSLLMLLACTALAAAGPQVPTTRRIRACIEEFDTGARYTFHWKTLEIGAPRHPQNPFEALAPLGGAGRSAELGYPVHAVFNLGGGAADIDVMYWLIADADGSWVIPPICRIAPGD